MTPFEDPSDERLHRAFAELGSATRAEVRPPGTAHVAWAAGRRRARRVVGAWAAAVLLLGGGGYAAASATVLSGDRANPAASGSPTASAAPTPTPAPSSQSPAASSPSAVEAGGGTREPERCHTTDLAGRLVMPMKEPPMYYYLLLTNVSGRECQVYGFPGLALADLKGNWLPTTATWVGTPTLVRVPPGSTVWSRLTVGPVVTPCTTTAATLLVTPPDETTQLRIKPPPEVCGQKTIEAGPLTPMPLPE
jgi:hypothetical protein